MSKRQVIHKKKKNLCVIFVMYIYLINGCNSSYEVTFITRHFNGDTFTIEGINPNEEPSPTNDTNCTCISGSFRVDSSSGMCRCQCNNTTSVFREDLVACVDTVRECSMIPSGMSGGGVPHFHIEQKTRFVSTVDEKLTLDINKTAENVSPFCIIVEGRFLTRRGWKTIEGSSFDVPLQIIPGADELGFRWATNLSSKKRAGGRILLINLLCKNAATTSLSSFQQCVTFKISGNHSVREAVFSLLNDDTKDNSALTKGVITGIGLLLGCLTFCYLLVSFFYLRLRRHKTKLEICTSMKEVENGKLPMKSSCISQKQNIHEADIILSKPSFRFPRPVLPGGEENVHQKKISNRTMSFNESQGESSEDEIYSTPSREEEIEGRRQRFERLRREMSASSSSSKDIIEDDLDDDYDTYEATPSSLGLAIVETSSSGVTEQQELPPKTNVPKPAGKGMRPRRRLFFNPSYFEPDMLQAPPPSALEFLSSVRAMMSVAKQKIQMKSFQPTLIDIPEDYGHLKGIKRNSSIYTKNSSVTPKQEKEKENILDEDKSETGNPGGKDTNNKNKDESSSTSLKDKIIENTKSNSVVETKQAADANEKVHQNFKPELPPRIVKPKSLSFCAPRKELAPSANQGRMNSFRESDSTYGQKPVMRSSSIKRNWSLKENKQHLKSSVENIKQEIQSKLNRVSSISRIQSFKKNKKENTTDSSPESSLSSEARKNKVNRWLHSIEIQTSNSGTDAGKNTLVEAYNSSSESNRNNCCVPEHTNSVSSSGSIHKNKALNDLGAESNPSVSSYISNEDFLPCQQDNEVSVIDINTHFYEKNPCIFSDQNHLTSFVQEMTDSTSISSSKCLLGDIRKDLSLVQELQPSPYYNKRDDAKEKSYQLEEENSYEEIMYREYSLNSDSINKLDTAPKNNTDSNINYKKLNNEDSKFSLIDPSNFLTENICAPESNSIVNQAANNFLCIELSDDSCKESLDRRQSFCKGGNKISNPVKRNDSIIQDSLERPKVKKKLNSEDEIGGKEYNNTEKTAVSSLISNWNLCKPDKNSAVRRSKTMKTFKDYKRIKFCSSKNNENKLTFFGESINLNYSTSKSTGDKAINKPPPIPPKQTRCHETPNSLDTLFHSRDSCSSSSSPTKPRIRYSSSLSPFDFEQRQRHLVQIYSDIYDGLQKNDSCSKELNDFDREVPVVHLPSTGMVYDPIDINQLNNRISFKNETKTKATGNSDIEIPKYPLNLPFADPNHFHNLQITDEKNLPCNNLNSMSSNVLSTPYTTNKDELKSDNTEFGRPTKYPGISLSKKNSFCGSNSKNFKTDNSVDELSLDNYLTYVRKVRHETENQSKDNEEQYDWKNDLNITESLPDQQLFNGTNNFNSVAETPSHKNSVERKDSFYKSRLLKAQHAAEQIKSNLKKCNSVTRQNSFKKRTSNFIQRSVSLHRMAQGSFGKANRVSSFSEKKNARPKLSIYVNDSFSIDD